MRQTTAAICGLAMAVSLFSQTAAAVEGPAQAAPGRFSLTEDRASVHVIHDGRSVKVKRVQDPEYELEGYFARTVRDCPPLCIQPLSAAPSVATVAEVELFDLLENDLRDGQALLIDVRTPSWYAKETIPGSINIPFTEFLREPDDPELLEWLHRFGVQARQPPDWLQARLEQWGWVDTADLTDKWDFSKAKRLVLWCNGPTCSQAPRAIRGLLAAGYPAGKLLYYRGGMQMWKFFGLTTVVPGVTENGR